MKYKRYADLCSQTCEPVLMPIVTQPNAALPLREILERFSSGDNSVLSHLPVDDFTDKTSDEQFFNDDSFDIPEQFEDKLQTEEFLIQQEENKKILVSLSNKKVEPNDEPNDESNDEPKKEKEVE